MDRPALLSLVDKENLIGAEIGVNKGWNAINILNTLNIQRLYLVDPYFIQDTEPDKDGERPYYPDKEGYRSTKELAEDLLRAHSDKITWMIQTSEDASDFIHDESLDFVYIDGDHKYEAVRKDIHLWYPKVKIGGTIGGHDFCDDHVGIIKAVLEAFGTENLNHKGLDWWIVK